MLAGLISRWTIPALMRVFQRLTDLGDDLGDDPIVEFDFLPDQVFERLTFEILHRDILQRSLGADIVDRHDIWMRQLAGGLSFAVQALFQLFEFSRIIDEVQANGLQRHRAVDRRVDAAIDGPHGAFAEDAGDLIAAEVLNIHLARDSNDQSRRSWSWSRPRLTHIR